MSIFLKKFYGGDQHTSKDEEKEGTVKQTNHQKAYSCKFKDRDL